MIVRQLHRTAAGLIPAAALLMLGSLLIAFGIVMLTHPLWLLGTLGFCLVSWAVGWLIERGEK